MDESVRAALREHADGAVQVEELLDGARRRGVRRRRLRHALVGCGTAAAVVAVVGAAFVLRPTAPIPFQPGGQSQSQSPIQAGGQSQGPGAETKAALKRLPLAQ